MNHQKHSTRYQQGVGMIEVLVTLVILSIGLLGVASLQFVGSFSNKEALARTQAVMVSQQMAERLKASTVSSSVTDGFVVHNNYFNPDIYNFKNLSCGSSLPPYQCYCLSFPANITNCQENECTQAEIAIFDAYQMSCATVMESPKAELFVTCDDNDNTDIDACTAGSIHTIMIKWPAQKWLGNSRVVNENCNVDGNAIFDCVVKEIAL